MDINTISKTLKEKYNCMVINIFQYKNVEYIKGLESLQRGIRYRYFKINQNEITEELDKNILDFLIEKCEIHEDVIY